MDFPVKSLVTWSRRSIWSGLISSSGVVLIVAFFYHLLLMGVSIELLLLGGGSIILAGGIVSAGYFVHRSSLGKGRVALIAGYFVAGMLVAVTFLAASLELHFSTHGMQFPHEFVIYARGATTGGAGGLLLGWNDAHRRKNQQLIKRQRDNLERSKNRLRLLFDEAPNGILVHDIEGEILDVNETLVENLGYTRQELLSMDVFDIEVGSDEEFARNLWKSLEPGSMHKVEIEGTHQRKDGSTYPSEVWISRVTSTFQEEDCFIVLIRDITDRKQREREQRETQQRLELAIETADVGVWEGDIQSETVHWNDSMETLVGLEPGTFDGTYDAFIDRVHPDDRSGIERSVENALQQQSDFEQEFRLRHESGEYRWFLTRARVVTDSNNTPDRMIGVGIDISERIAQTQQLEVLDRVLRHNLRNDMTTIQGFAETIQTDADGLTEETEVIIETSRQLIQTVDKEREIVELLVERPKREEIELVGEVCEHLVADARDEHPEATIEFDHPEAASVTAIQKIGRAIEELIENAIIYNDQEAPEVSLVIESSDETVRIEIADNGPGIPEEEVQILTNEHEIDPLYHGTGMGLWLVYWIVKLSDGTLTFEENEPRGSVITIELKQST